METFFVPGEVADPIYRALRDGDDIRHQQGRQHLEQLWNDCRSYIDLDARQKATRDLCSVFWELRLAHTLMETGKQLVQRTSLGFRNNRGPDLFVAKPDVWLEAVVLHAGDGPDALESEYELGKVYDGDPDGLVLRMTSVIREKSAKLRAYIDDGIIGSGQSTIIAVSGVALPFRYKYSPIYPPEIVRAVFPVNHLVLELNQRTSTVVGSHLQYREDIQKRSGASVPTNFFLDSPSAHVSAILFDEGSWVESAGRPGAGFTVVHNPNASAALPEGWHSAGDEYWLRDESSIQRHRH